MLPYAPWLIWIIPIASSLFVPVIAYLGGKSREYFAVIVGIITTIFAFSIVPDIYFSILEKSDFILPWIPSLGVGVGVFVDPLSVLFANLAAFFSLVVLIYSVGYMAEEKNLTYYYFFMLLFMGSMIGLVTSDNFFQMFIFWEIVGLCSYSLVSFWHHRPEAVRAGVKVFLMTRVGDVCFLAAIGLLYASLGSFSFPYIMAHIKEVPIPTLTVIAYLMLAGAIAKSAQLPLHTWLYSAMEAPTSVSALLHGATMVKAGVYLIARLFTLLGPIVTLIPMWLHCVAWVGALSAFIGATLALYTPDIKGVPAYSTISQIGFMFAALGAASSPSSLGWFAALFHMISHAFFQGLGFLAIGGIIHVLGTRDMRQMGGLRKLMPITFWLCIVVMLARTGVPPFASFFSKGLIISSLWSTGDFILVLTIYASTAITFAYTLRFIILTFLLEPSERVRKTHLHEPPKTMLFASSILAILCFAWGFLGPSIGRFMGVYVEISLNKVFSLETLVFILILLIGGTPIYINYYEKSEVMKKIRDKFIEPLAFILEHGYFFDFVYEKTIAGGILMASRMLRRTENFFFGQIPYMVANSILRLAGAVQKYLDILVDEMLYIAVNKTVISASKIRGVSSSSLEHYMAAILTGFLIILVLILITMLG